MNRYKSYKEVDLPWLKEIPSHWEVKKIRHIFEERKEKNVSGKEKFVLSVLKGIGVIPYSEKGSIGNKASENIENYKIVYKDDIVLNSMNMMIGSFGKSSYKGVLSHVYYVLKLNKKEEVDINYLEYVFKNSIFYESFRVLGKGILDHRLRVSMEALKYEHLPLPSLQEQTQIANYLDWKINEIDKLIAKEKEKIKELELLFKNKLGEIFKKLNVKERSIKNYLLTPISDGPHETPEFIDKGIPFVSVESVENGKINIEKKRGYISEKLYKIYCKKLKPQLNDIFLVKSGSTTGKVVLVDFETEFSVWSPLALIRVNRNVDYRFMFYMLSSEYFQEQIRLNWSFGTQPNIGMKVISNLKVKIPFKIEQEKIVDLAKKLELNINNLINKTNQQIQNLELLKQSLIAEVVTGQRDVRHINIPPHKNFTPPSLESTEEPQPQELQAHA